MSEQVYIFDGADPAREQATEDARKTFKYFWRELSWEQRRIVKGLELAVVKFAFSDGPRTDGQPEYEHMWVGELEFDGETLSGQLINAPNWLSSVQEGDLVQLPFSHLSDWMMASGGRAYGGFTVNLIRSKMGRAERKQHDDAWSLDFGDPAVVRVELFSPEKPRSGFLARLFGNRSKRMDQHDGFEDHPMCVNSLAMIEAQLKADPAVLHAVDQAGLTLLHTEALAGNFGVVKLLVAHGANVATRTTSGRTAGELARGVGWLEIAEYLGEPN
ncbi:MAG: DUF2314 domain-containing protein [Pseudomonadota bacterium]